MEEINLHEIFTYFKERILLLIAIILVVVACGSIYSVFLKTPLYQSNVTVVLVSEESSTTQSYSSSDVQLNKSLVGTYSEIIKSRKVLDQVINNLSLDISTAELSSNITVASVNDTEIIKVSVLDKNNIDAANIANEIVKVFSQEVTEIYQIQNVSVVDDARVSQNPYNINLVKDLLIYFVVGIVVALAIIFILYYFDTTIKSSNEIEEKFGLPIFGVVPKVKEK